MRNFFERLKDFLIFTIVGLYWGFIGGLAIWMTFFAARHKPFWCLGFTVFFALFHLSDLNIFFNRKNWLALSGRLIALFVITSFIVSLFVIFAFGDYGAMDSLDALVFLIVMPVSLIAATFWFLLKRFGSRTVLFRELNKIVEGSHVLGVFWKS